MPQLTNTTSLRFPVQTDDDPDASFAGHFYTATGPRTGLLQVLVHGSSYDHRYWDVPRLNGRSYSYAEYMTARGHDLLAVDLPGAGDSSRPGGDAVSLHDTGEAISRAVGTIRKTRAEVDEVALVGHSLGTIVAVYAQAWWPFADALVGTGTGFSSSLLPSPYGPGVRERVLLDPYPSPAPEVRRAVFYHEPNTDPEMIAYDNRVLRTSLPRRLWADSIAVRNDPERAGLSRITCPVLLQLGEFDPVLPGNHAETERGFWPVDRDVTVEQVDGCGHCLNLHLKPSPGWEAIDRFLRR